MKYAKILTLASFFVSVPTQAKAEYYKVTVKRLEKDLYKTDDGVYIETRWCYEYASGSDAVLKYENGSYDNKLILDSGTSCEAKGSLSR